MIILQSWKQVEAELEARVGSQKKQYEYYHKKLLEVDENVKQITLNEIGKISMCKRIFKNETLVIGDIPFYKIGTFGKKT